MNKNQRFRLCRRNGFVSNKIRQQASFDNLYVKKDVISRVQL